MWSIASCLSGCPTLKLAAYPLGSAVYRKMHGYGSVTRKAHGACRLRLASVFGLKSSSRRQANKTSPANCSFKQTLLWQIWHKKLCAKCRPMRPQTQQTASRHGVLKWPQVQAAMRKLPPPNGIWRSLNLQRMVLRAGFKKPSASGKPLPTALLGKPPAGALPCWFWHSSLA